MGSESGRAAAPPSGVRSRVVVTGAAGALGRRVCALAAADPTVDRVVALDRRTATGLGPTVQTHVVDLVDADLKSLFEGADAVVHLAQADVTDAVSTGTVTGDGRLAQRVLEAAGAVDARHVVVLSSAAAYGAWANNPLPLTEDSPLRPNPGAWFAAEKAELERSAADWRDDHPGSTVTVLRPTLTVATDGDGWLTRALRPSAVAVGVDEPPAQFLDLDDLAAAVDLARRARLDGPRNVAPDGWIDGDVARALAGAPRLHVPERVAIRVAGWGWRWGLTATPPVLLPYTVHPWVVANDRLRADGWVPGSSNEEAYVAAHTAGRLATLTPRRRQELLLGATAATVLASAAGVLGLLGRRRRRALRGVDRG